MLQPKHPACQGPPAEAAAVLAVAADHRQVRLAAAHLQEQEGEALQEEQVPSPEDPPARRPEEALREVASAEPADHRVTPAFPR
jgi:hypothetical protein